MAVNRPPSAAGTHDAERPAQPVLVSRRLLGCGLVAMLMAGCVGPWQSSRTKASSAAGSQIKDVKQFIEMPRVGLPFDKTE
jgi:hypothetical protein